MSLPKVYVTFALPPVLLTRLQAYADVEQWTQIGSPPKQTLIAHCKDAQGLLCALTDKIDAEVIQQCEHLNVVSSCSVGVDHVDQQVLAQRQIPLGHTPGVLVETTAELTFALLLASARRIVEGDRYIRQQQWQAERRWYLDMMLGQDLYGATLGIIGLGEIGQAVARRANAFGMKVIAWTPSMRKVDGVTTMPLEHVLAESDFLCVTIAYSDTTHHLIDAQALTKMKPSAMLINTARGGIVDEQALYQALKSGRVAGAALDVFAEEPVPKDHPLLELENVVVTPHIGSASERTRGKMASLAVDNLIAGLTGATLPHQVKYRD